MICNTIIYDDNVNKKKQRQKLSHTKIKMNLNILYYEPKKKEKHDQRWLTTLMMMTLEQ